MSGVGHQGGQEAVDAAGLVIGNTQRGVLGAGKNCLVAATTGVDFDFVAAAAEDMGSAVIDLLTGKKYRDWFLNLRCHSLEDVGNLCHCQEQKKTKFSDLVKIVQRRPSLPKSKADLRM